MHFVLKATIVFLLSISTTFAAEDANPTDQQTATDVNHEPSSDELATALSSLATSLNTLAKSTEGLRNTAMIDAKVGHEYLELQSTILKKFDDIHQAIARNSVKTYQLSNEDYDLPVLKNRIDNLYESQSYFSYADFAAIAITAVAVLVTVVGIAIAVLSFWGYKNIRATTKASAKAVAENVATKTTEQKIDSVVKDKLIELVDEGRLTQHLEDVVDALILRNQEDTKKVNWDELDTDWDELDAREGKGKKEDDS